MSKISGKNIEEKGWMSLDNAAKIFPSVTNRSLSSVFRIGCELRRPVKIKELYNALNKTCKRFPYYLTSLHKGFFWYYLEYDLKLRPQVVVEDKRPCIAFPVKDTNHTLFRIVIRSNNLSVEFLHVLTDGGGAVEFFRSLIVTYLRECGHDIPYSYGILNPESSMDESEIEDSYNKYFNKEIPPPGKIENAWHLPFMIAGKEYINITQAEIPVSQLKSISKEESVTITEYLASVYLFCLQEIWQTDRSSDNKIIRLEIPVNMRRVYPSKTMRNFSLFVLPEFDMRLGNYTFEEILKYVHNYMQIETEKKSLSRIIARNVKPEKNVFIRTTPVFIKDIFLSAAYKKHGVSKYSGVLTNVGIAKMPVEAKPHILRMSMLPPPPVKDLKVSCGVISYLDKLCISFANNTRNLELERKFFKFLSKKDMNVKILKNYWNER